MGGNHKMICMLLLLCLGCSAMAQQNVQFSQYAFNGLSVNPAYAGYKDVWYLNSIYRHQWTGMPGAPRTGGISVDGPMKAMHNSVGVGFGLQAMFDQLGPQQAFSLYGSYSYRIALDEEQTKRLCLGIGIGITQFSLDGKALQYLDAGDPVLPGGGVNSMTPDARFGIYYHTPSFYLGISALDLFSIYTSPGYSWKGYNYESIRRTQHLYITTGFMKTLSDHVELKPSLLIKEDFKGPTSLDINAMLLIDQLLWVGASYRTSVPLWHKSGWQPGLQAVNSASLIVEYYISEKYRMGYAYDLNINKLAGAQGGSHEISIGVMFPSKKYSTANPRYF